MAKRRAQAHVLTANEPCISVITTPITGLSTAHVMRGVNPHHEEFLGDSFTHETPIIAKAVIEEGSEFSAKEY